MANQKLSFPPFRSVGSVKAFVGKAGGLAAGMAVVLLYGDVLFSMAGTILHSLIEVLEMLLEHALEALFGVSGHTAQMLTAWIGAALLGVCAVVLWRRAARAVNEYMAAAEAHLRSLAQRFRYCGLRERWARFLIYGGLSLTAIYVLVF